MLEFSGAIVIGLLAVGIVVGVVVAIISRNR